MPQYLLNVIQPDGPPPEPDVLGPIMENLAALRQEMKDAGRVGVRGRAAPGRARRPSCGRRTGRC